MNTYLVMTQQADQPTVIEADLVDLTDPQVIEFRRKDGLHHKIFKKDVVWWDIHYLTSVPRVEKAPVKELVSS